MTASLSIRRQTRTIGVVTTSYPRFAGDPAGSFVAAHVAAMRAAGHRVDVIAAGDVRSHDRAAALTPASLSAAGTLLQRIPSRLFYRGGAPDRLEVGYSHAAAAAFTVRMCARVIRCARHWDLIVAHWLAPCALAALPVRVPLLAIAHGGDVHTLARMRLLAPTLALLRARRAHLAFVNDDLLALAQRHGQIANAAAIVQPMGIDFDRFAALEHRPTTPPTVLVVARLVPVKGVDVAIAAMRLVRSDAQLVIVGDGPERAALAQSCAPLDRVTFVGAVTTAERDRWLARASVVAVPSRVLANGRTEGTPMIALESLAAGVPVVASQVGGLRCLPSVVGVAPDDPAALATAIDRALQAPPAPQRLRAVAAQYDWPIVEKRLMAHACA